MRVLCYMADSQGCGVHRIGWPASAAAANPNVQVALGQAMAVAAANRQPEVALIPQEVAAVKPHVIVFQRPMSIPIVKLIRELQRTGYAVVIDIDDDFTKLPDTNPAWYNTSPDTDPIQNRDNHKMACGFADLLIASTPSIAESYGGGDRVHVIRNRIPEHWLKVRLPKDDPPAVLWTGVYKYHEDDLEVMDGQLGVALSRCGDAKFRHIGGIAADQPRGPEVEEATDTRGRYQWQGWLNLTEMQWSQAISRCTVGITPLCDRPFNHGKSWIKPLEFAALGLPAVMSPSPEYLELHSRGVGLIANHPMEWRKHIERLLKDVEYRSELIKQGEEVARELTHPKGAHEWIEAWEHAADTAKAKLAVA